MLFASPKTTVLCYSHDSLLLVTRQWLLEHLGSGVLTVMSGREFREKVLRDRIDLVLFCQTVSAEERAAAVAFLQEHAPSVRCVTMFTSRYKRSSEPECVWLDANCGPEEFLHSIGRILPLPPPQTGITVAMV